MRSAAAMEALMRFFLIAALLAFVFLTISITYGLYRWRLHRAATTERLSARPRVEFDVAPIPDLPFMTQGHLSDLEEGAKEPQDSFFRAPKDPSWVRRSLGVSLKNVSAAPRPPAGPMELEQVWDPSRPVHSGSAATATRVSESVAL